MYIIKYLALYNGCLSLQITSLYTLEHKVMAHGQNFVDQQAAKVLLTAWMIQIASGSE
jgi:hypothetical protein